VTPADLRSVLDRAVDELLPDQLADAIGCPAAFQARLLARLTSPPSKPLATDDVVDVATLAGELGLARSWLRAQARANALPHLIDRWRDPEGAANYRGDSR